MMKLIAKSWTQFDNGIEATMNKVTRREFVTAATTTVAAASILVVPSPAQAKSSNNKIRHAVIGMGGRSQAHVEEFTAHPDCEIVAICDVDPAHIKHAPKGVSKHADYREILDNPKIDSISIATPDHWHTPIAAAALKAGKHVYVEKPCSHTVAEGIYLEKAADTYGKIIQHGTQGRSSAGYLAGIQFIRDGHLGKVRVAKAINHQLRNPIGRAEETEPPEGVDYDRWLGPAPEHPFTKNRWHYNWHWFWDYGAGDIANDGVHHIDLARWGLDVGYPNAISASGAQLFYNDDHETPDTQTVTYEFHDCHLIYEMRLWTPYKLEGHDNGAVFYGDKGKLEMGRAGCTVTLANGETKNLGGPSDLTAHIRNYLDCIRANDPTNLNAPIKEGAISSALCHLGNIAIRVDRKLHFDPSTHTCENDPEANALLTKHYRTGYELAEIG